MITLTFDRLAQAVDGRLVDSEAARQSFTGVSIDSRTLQAGELFFALVGEAHDGHDHLRAAFQNGAAGAVVREQHPEATRAASAGPAVAVTDTHQALTALARWYARRLQAKVIGITGSNGKTTTKEFTYSLLRALGHKVYRSAGNLNNLFGLPLSILRTPTETECAVYEYGISTPGEMTQLAAIHIPDVIVMTNVGPTHLEFLGTLENVARTKLELVEAAPEGTPVVVNADDPVLYPAAQKVSNQLVTFGLSEGAQYRPEAIEHQEDNMLAVTVHGQTFRLPLFGKHQVYNFLAAYAAIHTAGHDFSTVKTESISLASSPMRGQQITLHGVTVISDCYNANPESVRSSLESLSVGGGGRLVIVLGDMLELGADAEYYHRQAGQQLAAVPFSKAVLVGAMSRHMRKAASEAGVSSDRLVYCDTAEEAANAVAAYLKRGDTLFVKGSRGIGLEEVIEHWEESGGDN